MEQRNKFRIALVLITLVCFIDYQMFTEGYAVRNIAPIKRQIGHFVVLLSVVPIGYWAWKNHPIKWLNKLWITSYIIAIVFILIVGLLKTQTNILSDTFMEWVTSDIRYFFTSPLPHIILYMLSLLSMQKEN